MFGETFISGKCEITISQKWQMVVPKFTYVEVDDELLFAKIEENSCFTIFSKNKVFEKLSKLVNEQENVRTKQEYDFLQEKIDKIQNCCFDIDTANKKHVVMIPKPLRDNLTVWQKLYAKGGIALQMPCLHVYSDKQMIKRT